MEGVKIEAKIADARETSSSFRRIEDGPINLSITVFKNYEVYTARAVGGKRTPLHFAANSRSFPFDKLRVRMTIRKGFRGFMVRWVGRRAAPHPAAGCWVRFVPRRASRRHSCESPPSTGSALRCRKAPHLPDSSIPNAR